jgi:hypothetical protein
MAVEGHYVDCRCAECDEDERRFCEAIRALNPEQLRAVMPIKKPSQEAQEGRSEREEVAE